MEILRELMGGQTQAAFARRLGVSRQQINNVLLGKRRIGGRLLVELLRAFPERSEDILRAMEMKGGNNEMDRRTRAAD